MDPDPKHWFYYGKCAVGEMAVRRRCGGVQLLPRSLLWEEEEGELSPLRQNILPGLSFQTGPAMLFTTRILRESFVKNVLNLQLCPQFDLKIGNRCTMFVVFP